MRYVRMTQDVVRLIEFMVNAYIRPTDIKHMRHQHVEIVRGQYTYLRLRLPESKGHTDPITTMPRAVTTYLKLKAEQVQRRQGRPLVAEDYVFVPEHTSRNHALQLLQHQFEIVLEATGLRHDVNGEFRSLYSLRHSSIMYRLLYGDAINTLVLARNARTSVEMIDRFYARPLSGEMNIGMLQSRRRRRGGQR
jgi:phosphatidylserine/phosphatidylglycerophosphate/cardiolipin synthase-like enzyme